MGELATLFISTFATLMAVINPLEAIPIYLQLLESRDEQTHLAVATKSCLYAAALMLFFLVFGTFIMRIFGVPLSMVRIVGGIILMRLGFDLFAPSATARLIPKTGSAQEDITFVPLAMPVMVGPGVIATVLGMAALVERSHLFPLVMIVVAILAATLLTFLSLIYARRLMRWFGKKGIDAATRIVGFFVAAMGMGLIFHGVFDALVSYGIVAAHVH
jgi:multiple antibiotic resistance protein